MAKRIITEWRGDRSQLPAWWESVKRRQAMIEARNAKNKAEQARRAKMAKFFRVSVLHEF